MASSSRACSYRWSAIHRLLAEVRERPCKYCHRFMSEAAFIFQLKFCFESISTSTLIYFEKSCVLRRTRCKEMPPILSKDSANRAKNKIKRGLFIFFSETTPNRTVHHLLLEPACGSYFLILRTGMMLLNASGRVTSRASFVRVNFTLP